MHPSFRSVMIVCLAGLFFWGIAHGQQPPPQSKEASRFGPAANGGLRAYLDPATGRLIDHPPYGKPTLEFNEQELYRFSTSHFGLIEQKLPEGNGYAVGLKGRFRQGTAASVGESGNSRVEHLGGEIFLSPTGRWIQEKVIQDRAGTGKNDR